VDTLFEQFTREQRTEFEFRLQNLQIVIGNAEKEALKNAQKFRNALNFFSQLVGLGQNVATSWATGNWVAMTGQIAGIGANLLGIDLALRNDPDIQTLREVYQRVEDEYGGFLEYIKSANADMVKARDATLSDMVDIQEMYNQSLQATHRSFDGLLRLTVMNRIAKKSGGQREFLINISQLEKIFTSYPKTLPDLSLLKRFPSHCALAMSAEVAAFLSTNGTTPADCLKSSPLPDKPTALRVKKDQALFPGLVLYRFEADAVPQTMELHGLLLANQIEWGPD
jgi:hypothetical protein